MSGLALVKDRGLASSVPGWMLDRAALVKRVRSVLLGYAEERGALEDWLCDCGGEHCSAAGSETISLHRLLFAAATGWPDGGVGVLRSIEGDVRAALVDLGDVFGLWECPCPDPDCGRRRAREQPTGVLVGSVAVYWNEMAGVGLGDPVAAEWERQVPVLATNRALIWLVVEHLIAKPLGGWREVIETFRVVGESAYTRECVSLVHACTMQWVVREAEGLGKAIEVVAAIAAQAEMSQEEGEGLIMAVANAVRALQVKGLVREDVFQVLYAPLEVDCPVHSLVLRLQDHRRGYAGVDG